MKIHLVLTDDWELRGDGSGNMRAIQFETIRKLTQIYDKFGLKGSFNIELMQQFYHKKFGEKYPELKKLSFEWEEVVKEVFSRGHDMQIHLHTHWISGVYRDGNWELSSDWNIVNHPSEVVDSLIKKSKNYLEELLQPINPEYRCISYRGGTWAIAPSEFMLQILANNKIILDISLVNDLTSKWPVSIDYRDLEEPFLPFYPQMSDARKVNTDKSPIICVPNHSFYSRNKIILSILQKFRNKNNFEFFFNKFDKYLSPRSLHIQDAGYNLDEYSYHYNVNRSKAKFRDRFRSHFAKTHRISDLSNLNYPLFKKMMKDIRAKALKTGLEFVPVIIANHTKNIGNFKSIEKFAEYFANADDIDIITSSQLAKNLIDGVYPIRKY